MWHLNPGQCLDGLYGVAIQGEISEDGEVDMGNFLHQCCPIVVLYINHQIHKFNFLTFDSVVYLTCRLT